MVNLDIREKEIVGLLGPNGAGKSSTFNMITLQTRRTAGDIKILDYDIGSASSRGEELSITAQENILWPNLSINEHFQVIGRLKGLSQ